MDESLQQDPLRMTPEEAEQVIERFREQEEAFAQEMEARASMPTVKDLAEGLNVTRERIEQMLQEIRRPAPEPAQKAVPGKEAMQEVKRRNRSALTIGAVILAVVLSLGILFALILRVSPSPPTAQPAPPDTSTFEDLTRDPAPADAP
ncbi:MAG: hypothetical protein IH945_07890 [Armatimonadetes bacterium]|nr:hypothetical protein [Armatimonadota bacterium]